MYKCCVHAFYQGQSHSLKYNEGRAILFHSFVFVLRVTLVNISDQCDLPLSLNYICAKVFDMLSGLQDKVLILHLVSTILK